MSKPKFRVVVAGSRGFDDFPLLREKLTLLIAGKVKTHEVVIVSGGARGADQLGEQYARQHGLDVEVMPADWNRLGRSAGYQRNQDMADVADAVVAFWNGSSPGTRHMINLAKERNLPLRVIRY